MSDDPGGSRPAGGAGWVGTAPAAPPPGGPGRPTPVVTLPTGATVRFAAGGPDDLPAGLLDRLAGLCPLDTDEAPRTEAARDWWPLTATWAAAGEVPARAAVVASPRSTDEVAGVLAACHEARVPVTPAAGRSGVCGASVPVFGGVLLDLTAMAGITAWDEASGLVDVLPGTFGDRLEDELAGLGATLGHWPQSMALSTVGGWLACRSAGQWSTRYGKVEDLVAGLEVVLADGRVLRTGGRAPRAAVGPDVTQLLVGSEGTLGVITSARLRARPRPPAAAQQAWALPTFADGLEVCRRTLRRGATPAVLRLYDATESARSFDVEGACVLIAHDEAEEGLVAWTASVLAAECRAGGAEPLDTGLVGRWLAHRNSVADLGGLAGAGIVADTIEVAAPWGALPDVHRSACAAVGALDATLAVSAHQSHAYLDGACLYFTFAGRPAADGREAYYTEAWDAVVRATLGAGGALSHHHGVGLNRSRWVGAALDGGLEVLAAVKGALDPHGILNPGKLGLASPWGPPPWPAPPLRSPR